MVRRIHWGKVSRGSPPAVLPIAHQPCRVLRASSVSVVVVLYRNRGRNGRLVHILLESLGDGRGQLIEELVPGQFLDLLDGGPEMGPLVANAVVVWHHDRDHPRVSVDQFKPSGGVAVDN